MIYKSPKLLLILILSIICVALSATFVFGVYEVLSKNKETSKLLNQANHDTEVEALVQSIKLAQNSAMADIKAFDDLVFSSDKLVILIENIEGAGRAFGLDINISSVGKVEEKKSVTKTENKNTIQPQMIRISMETEGSWSSTFSFLRAIESLSYRVMIDEATFSKGGTHWQSMIVLLLHSFD